MSQLDTATESLVLHAQEGLIRKGNFLLEEKVLLLLQDAVNNNYVTHGYFQDFLKGRMKTSANFTATDVSK